MLSKQPEANGPTKNMYMPPIGVKVHSVPTHEPHQQIVTHTWTAPQTNICQVPVKSPALVSSHTVIDNETFKQSFV